MTRPIPGQLTVDECVALAALREPLPLPLVFLDDDDDLAESA